MENKKDIISCPHCLKQINVNEVLIDQLEAQFNEKFSAKQKDENERIKDLELLLNTEKEKVQKQHKNLQESIDISVKKELINERDKLKKELLEETAEKTTIMEKELKEKSKQVKELHKSKAEIEKLKREKDEMQSKVEAESQIELSKVLVNERGKIKKIEEERNELKIRALNKQLEDQKKLTEEMTRKQEQGSMQLQGEVQELAIEEWLISEFPLDNIDEIKKGVNGADCLQTINTRNQPNCGGIYYESKRTKSFQPSWIEKFKDDMREKSANVGILVTQNMPTDMERAGQIKGVWVCSFGEFKVLSRVLRESVIGLSNAIISQENKGDKIEILYQYLSGDEFRMQIEAIVEGFSQMKIDLDTEKRSFKRIWKQREKQIEKVTTNTIEMYGSIKGIAGNSIQNVKALELNTTTD